MENDVDAKQITLRYEGGSITMSRGNAKDIFGDTFEGLRLVPVEKTVSVIGHDRVKTIGGSSKSISPYTYTFKSWPTSTASNAAAGTVILMEWTGSGDAWSGRVTGPMWRAADYFNTNAKKILTFRTQRGTYYGPFASI